KVVRRPNEGPGSAWNAGIELAAGDYILILENRYRLAPRCLAKLESALAQNASYGFAVGQVEVEGDGRRVLEVPRFNPYLERQNGLYAASAIVRRAGFERGIRYSMELGLEARSVWLGCIDHGITGCVIDQPLFRRPEPDENTTDTDLRLQERWLQAAALYPR